VRLDLSRRIDGELLREFSALVEKDRRSTAELLAYVGEIQARRLFASKGYSSMYMYCVRELHMSGDVAWKRTQVARLARRFPVILEMIADGRLHLTAVVKLLAYRKARGFTQLLEAAAHKSKFEIELLLAARFPRPDTPTEVRPLGKSRESQKLVPEPVVQTRISATDSCTSENGGDSSNSRPAPGLPSDDRALLPNSPSGQSGLVSSEAPTPRARIEPLAPQRFAIQVTVGQTTHDKLRRAQELLGHRVASGDLEQVLDRALDALIRQLEHAKFAATDKPRAARQRSTAGKRHVPAHVKRAVHERDGGRCTFVSDSGRRCEERRALHFDHIEPFARELAEGRSGEATVSGIRLLCPAHNQLEAERVFGAGFMEQKRRASG
jgi:hypothetical protein